MKDLLDILLDEDNKDPIVLKDDKGKKLAFEQIAIIPMDIGKDKSLYVVLKPIDKIEGVSDDEAIVFRVEGDKDGNTTLCVENDELIAMDVFEKYYELLDEAADKKRTDISDGNSETVNDQKKIGSFSAMIADFMQKKGNKT